MAKMQAEIQELHEELRAARASAIGADTVAEELRAARARALGVDRDASVEAGDPGPVHASAKESMEAATMETDAFAESELPAAAD
jgi:hypothetical protein